MKLILDGRTESVGLSCNYRGRNWRKVTDRLTTNITTSATFKRYF